MFLVNFSPIRRKPKICSYMYSDVCLHSQIRLRKYLHKCISMHINAYYESHYLNFCIFMYAHVFKIFLFCVYVLNCMYNPFWFFIFPPTYVTFTCIKFLSLGIGISIHILLSCVCIDIRFVI